MHTDTTPACRNNLCSSGRRVCPTPQACQVPDETDACPAWLAALLRAADCLSVRVFWVGYAAGVVTAAAGITTWILS